MVRLGHIVDLTASGLARVVILIYVMLCHIAILFLWPMGLKIQYINHKPWPYTEFWKAFFEPMNIND